MFYGFRRGRKRFVWFPSLAFYGFRRGRKTLFSLVVSVLAAASEIIFDSSQIRDCAGDTRARNDSDIVMRSPAARDSDLTSGLRGFNPGRVRFQGNCVCLFLFACCLLLFVFVGFLIPSRAGRQSREAEPRSSATCRVSAMFPLRFRYVSVAFPWRASPWPLPRGKCEGSLRQRAIKETYVGAR